MGKIKLRTIREFRNGNKDAFEDIFYAYKDVLYYISYFYVRDYDDANDCVQEIFIKLINKIGLFDERKAEFETWLYVLAKSCILNFLRAKDRYNKRVVTDDEEVLKYKDEECNKLQHTLYDLEEIMGRQMYVVYILRVGYNMSFDSIAEATDSSRETVRRIYYESLKLVNYYMGDNKHVKE